MSLRNLIGRKFKLDKDLDTIWGTYSVGTEFAVNRKCEKPASPGIYECVLVEGAGSVFLRRGEIECMIKAEKVGV